MEFKVIAQTNFCLEEEEYDFECYNGRNLACWFYDNVFAKESLILNDELVFYVEMIITKLYDLNGILVPKNKWIDHNVDISTD